MTAWSLATKRLGAFIGINAMLMAIAITPDGKTAYACG